MKRIVKRVAVASASASVAVLLVTVGVMSAAITGTSGQVVTVSPPPSALMHAYESDTEIRAWDEQQNVTLPKNISANITTPGTYTSTGSLTPGVIPAGTVVSSQILHADPVGAPTTANVLSGSITTDGEVLGIIVGPTSLSGSDFLGAPGTVYDTGNPFRGLEFDPPNSVTLTITLHSVSVTVGTRIHLDEIRVVTAPPSGAGQGCTPGFWKQTQHFDQWVGYTPDQKFNDVFGVAMPGDPTLLTALQTGGGGVSALGRHAVAALLNSANTDVSFLYSPAEVIDAVQQAFANGTFEGTKNILAAQNEMGCPLS